MFLLPSPPIVFWGVPDMVYWHAIRASYIFSSIIAARLGLRVTVVLGALLRGSFEKPFSQALIPLCFTDPPSFAHCISSPGFLLPTGAHYTER